MYEHAYIETENAFQIVGEYSRKPENTYKLNKNQKVIVKEITPEREIFYRSVPDAKKIVNIMRGDVWENFTSVFMLDEENIIVQTNEEISFSRRLEDWNPKSTYAHLRVKVGISGVLNARYSYRDPIDPMRIVIIESHPRTREPFEIKDTSVGIIPLTSFNFLDPIIQVSYQSLMKELTLVDIDKIVGRIESTIGVEV
jgi:hypothetical protein